MAKKSKNKGFIEYLGIAAKGAGMGAADVVPGVSGGTIAFITGIYEELVASLNACDLKALKLLFTGKFKQFWSHINGWFLLSLFAGILVSVLSLAKIVTHCLASYPVATWAFFFGLVLASAFFILKDQKLGKGGLSLAANLLTVVIGIALGVIVCTLTPTSTPMNLWFIFLCGVIAICAMILPGISGSFILVILGKYEYILLTLKNLTSGVEVGKSLLVLLVFALGAVIGLLAFSKLLHWLLATWHDTMVILLAGFVLGSLVKIFRMLISTDAINWLTALGAAFVGIVTVSLVQLLSSRKR